jgi:hypothetical protein
MVVVVVDVRMGLLKLLLLDPGTDDSIYVPSKLVASPALPVVVIVDKVEPPGTKPEVIPEEGANGRVDPVVFVVVVVFVIIVIMEGVPVTPMVLALLVAPVNNGGDVVDDDEARDDNRLADGVVTPSVRPIMPCEDAATANSIRT